jgi:hypothetical protein
LVKPGIRLKVSERFERPILHKVMFVLSLLQTKIIINQNKASMRKAIVLLFVLTCVSGVAFSGGVETLKVDPQIRVIQFGQVVKVIYVNSDASDVRVSILDEHGDKVFSEKIRKYKGFIRPYNLMNLEEGTYRIEIEHEGDTFIRQIEHVNGKHKNPDEAELLAHVAKVTKPDRKKRFLLSVPCAGDDTLTVTIFSEDGYVLYEDTQNISSDFAQVYRIEDHPGNITVQVANQEGVVKRFYPEMK